MTRNAGAGLLLTQASFADELPKFGLPHQFLDGDWDAEFSRYLETPPGTVIHPEQLAYLIYTSGSTGEPKGVMIPVKGVASVARAVSRLMQISPADRVLQFAPISFDAHILDTFEALLTGAALVLATHDELLSSDGLERVVRAQGVTVTTLPPALLKTLEAARFPSLRAIISTGEACTPDILADWAAGRIFINGYGPTENTIASTVGLMQADTVTPDIGRPLANLTAYILDENFQPVPVGVEGELLVGGVGLARGYLGSPAATAEKFVPHPFAVGGERLYRTGDLARWGEDGKIILLGRLDGQIQIRGQRVEPGEIEAALLTVPGVRAAAVTADQAYGSPELAAWLVSSDRGLSATRIHEHLHKTLPEYMIPSRFRLVDALPLNANGKVARAALAGGRYPVGNPAPGGGRGQRCAAHHPRTGACQNLGAGLWARRNWHPRQLLPARRAFADGGGDDHAHPR